jgi:hypothetical protein
MVLRGKEVIPLKGGNKKGKMETAHKWLTCSMHALKIKGATKGPNGPGIASLMPQMPHEKTRQSRHDAARASEREL